MLVSQANIHTLIPQRPPFIMVDNLLSADETLIETSFYIQPGNVFVENREFQASGLIEHLAQSGAAGIAYQYLQSRTGQSGPPVGGEIEGFLASISHLELLQLPEVDMIIRSSIRPMKQFGRMVLIAGEVWDNEQLLMKCRMKLAGAG
ncbi:MAG: hypothetical protein AAFV07_09595 [Bacteroidota bacterium]